MKVIGYRLSVIGKIQKTAQYFSVFDYVPTIDEIRKFYPQKISQYTLGEYCIKRSKIKDQISKFEKERQRRKLISEQKINKIKTYVNFLQKLPQIKLIGLSGTVAMNNAKVSDDIDLFIITASNRLWTGRLIATLLALMMGIKRPRRIKSYQSSIISYQDKICLNLFFDEKDLSIPKYKRTEYVAHEVLQMKPLVNKDGVYEWFLKANEWVFGLFPNAVIKSKIKDQRSKPQIKVQKCFCRRIINLISLGIELLVKKLQLIIISRHRTSEIITDTQLWFFPEDFEKKMHTCHSGRTLVRSEIY